MTRECDKSVVCPLRCLHTLTMTLKCGNQWLLQNPAKTTDLVVMSLFFAMVNKILCNNRLFVEYRVCIMQKMKL